MDEVRCDQLGEERRNDIGEEDDAFGDGTDEVLGGGEDDHVEDIVDEAKKPKGYNDLRIMMAHDSCSSGFVCSPR